MARDDDLQLLLSIQRGLLGQVTAGLRGVSADVDAERRRISLRFIFSRPPSDSEQDATSIAATLVIADYSEREGWQFDEEYHVVPDDERMNPLRLLAFQRCEDEWVGPCT
jgi:hypothetical protein